MGILNNIDYLSWSVIASESPSDLCSGMLEFSMVRGHSLSDSLECVEELKLKIKAIQN